MELNRYIELAEAALVADYCKKQQGLNNLIHSLKKEHPEIISIAEEFLQRSEDAREILFTDFRKNNGGNLLFSAMVASAEKSKIGEDFANEPEEVFLRGLHNLFNPGYPQWSPLLNNSQIAYLFIALKNELRRISEEIEIFGISCPNTTISNEPSRGDDSKKKSVTEDNIAVSEKALLSAIKKYVENLTKSAEPARTDEVGRDGAHDMPQIAESNPKESQAERFVMTEEQKTLCKFVYEQLNTDAFDLTEIQFLTYGSICRMKIAGSPVNTRALGILMQSETKSTFKNRLWVKLQDGKWRDAR